MEIMENVVWPALPPSQGFSALAGCSAHATLHYGQVTDFSILSSGQPGRGYLLACPGLHPAPRLPARVRELSQVLGVSAVTGCAVLARRLRAALLHLRIRTFALIYRAYFHLMHTLNR